MLLYLHGFASGPSSHKARVLSARFAVLGIGMEIPDLTPGEDGFERSSPSSMLAVAEGALARWRRDGLETMHFASGRRRRIGWQFFDDAAGLPAFPAVRIPTLCITGTRDETVPFEDVQAFVARTPSARLVAVDDGHDLAASLDRIFEEARAFLSPFTRPGSPR